MKLGVEMKGKGNGNSIVSGISEKKTTKINVGINAKS